MQHLRLSAILPKPITPIEICRKCYYRRQRRHGEVTVQLKYNGHSVVGRGAHPDVIVASAKAYINALNRLEFLKDNTAKVRVE